MIITSNQSEVEGSWSTILNEILVLFKGITEHVKLDDIKAIPEKSTEEIHQLSTSYQYVGLKLMFIFKMYVKGEKFPEGRMNKQMHQNYLIQCVEFLYKNNDIVELLQVNARSFFLAVSEIFTNQAVANTIMQLNNNQENSTADELSQSESPVFEISHKIIIERLSDIVEKLESIKHMEFEFWYFIIKIAISDWFKYNPQSLITRLYKSINMVLNSIIEFKEEVAKNPESVNLEENKYIGPNYIEISDIENDIFNALPFYAPFIDPGMLEGIVKCSTKLKINKISIFIYEQQGDFHKWIETYLKSDENSQEGVFEWLKQMYNKQNTLKEENIRTIENEILTAIKDLVTINSTRTGNVIDQWLPNQQRLVIKNLESNPDLQLKYLKDFLNDREQEIRNSMISLDRSTKSKDDIAEYRYFLTLHVKLLAELEKPELKEVVMKDYYPIEVLDDIKENTLIIQEARAYLK